MYITNKSYILSWIEKSKNEDDYFDKFVYGFFALNAMYSIYYESSERCAIGALFRNAFSEHSEEFREILDTREYKYFCNRRPIANCRWNPSSSYPQDTQAEKNILLDRMPYESNLAMLKILYQIRCNLFHGNKSFSSNNDQGILKNASELLLKYNDIFSQML